MAKTNINSTKQNKEHKIRLANIGIQGLNLLSEEDMKRLLGDNYLDETGDEK